MTIASAGPPDPGPATTPSRKTPEYLNARPWGRGFSPSQHPVHHEFMALGSLEPIPAVPPAVMARPGHTPTDSSTAPAR